MFVKNLFNSAGFDLKTANVCADFILDGEWRHQTFQVFGNGKEPTDQEIIQRVKDSLPANAEICTIIKVYGDYELSELEDMASRGPNSLAEIPKIECIFLGDKFC